MSETTPGLVAALLLTFGAAPLFAQPIPQPDPETTVVADLVVVAPTGGPAWWKVTRGESTVWIFGLPPAPMPTGMKWDRAPLERRLRGARALIVPTTDWSGFPDDGTRTLPYLAPPHLARKVEAASALLESPIDPGLQGTVGALIYLRPAYYRFYDLSHEVTPVVETAARRARVPILAQEVRRYFWTAQDVDPENPRMAECIEGVLQDVAIDPALYVKAGEAWAKGDVATLLSVAPRVSAKLCSHLFPSQWERSVDYNTRAIEEALKSPGKTLAALHIPQLVAEDGVLERLRKAGYTVSDPSRPLTE